MADYNVTQEMKRQVLMIALTGKHNNLEIG